jgi:hypothetical protein
MTVITELTANLTGNRSGRAGLNEGAEVVVKKDTPQEEMEKKKVGTHCKYSPLKGERPLGCSGRTTLRREQCDVLPKKPAYSEARC